MRHYKLSIEGHQQYYPDREIQARCQKLLIEERTVNIINFDPEGSGGEVTSHKTFQIMSLINPNQAEVLGSLIM